jgi:hypothetical protein
MTRVAPRSPTRAPLAALAGLFGLVCLAACSEPAPTPAAPGPGGGGQAIDEPGEECDPVGYAAWATQPAGALDERTAILPDGRLVSPDGAVIVVGGNPSDLVLSPDGALAYVIRQGNGLLVVDLATTASPSRTTARASGPRRCTARCTASPSAPTAR